MSLNKETKLSLIELISLLWVKSLLSYKDGFAIR